MTKPILCLDFDGVLHSYTSGWQGVDVIPDEAVEGAIQFLKDSLVDFEVQIFSSRSHQKGGIPAMQQWLKECLFETFEFWEAKRVFAGIGWPTNKPPAMVTIDDRAIRFTGKWPSVESLLEFKPWNKL